MSAPAGWYPDPYGGALRRYWDGTTWTAHVEQPAAQAVRTPPEQLRAPAGTRPDTVWIWLIVAVPLVSMIASIPALIWMSSFMTDYLHAVFAAIPPGASQLSDAQEEQVVRQITQEMLGLFGQGVGPMLLAEAAGLLLNAATVVFAWLDYRELVRRGVPKPFHWAWSFFTFAGVGNLITVIGRSVVVRRRTGTGLWPLWATIIVYIVLFIATFVVVSLMLTQMFGTIAEFTGSQLGA